MRACARVYVPCVCIRVCASMHVCVWGGCPVSCRVLFARRVRDLTVLTVINVSLNYDCLTRRFCTIKSFGEIGNDFANTYFGIRVFFHLFRAN